MTDRDALTALSRQETIREVVLRCRSCGKHQVMKEINQTCGCRIETRRCIEWHGWQIANIALEVAALAVSPEPPTNGAAWDAIYEALAIVRPHVSPEPPQDWKERALKAEIDLEALNEDYGTLLKESNFWERKVHALEKALALAISGEGRTIPQDVLCRIHPDYQQPCEMCKRAGILQGSKPVGQEPFSSCPRCRFEDGRWHPCRKHQLRPAASPAAPKEPR